MPKERKTLRRVQPAGWYKIENGLIHYVQQGWVKTECGLWIVPRMVQDPVEDREAPHNCEACLRAKSDTGDWS